MKPIFEIDGSRFSTLEGFYEEVSQHLIPGADWGHNLDAFNDILRGGFGTPWDGFVILWSNHSLSKIRLGYDETVRQLQQRLHRCHSSNVPRVQKELDQASQKQGPTVFDWLVEIIIDHGPNGSQASDGVDLVLQ